MIYEKASEYEINMKATVDKLRKGLELVGMKNIESMSDSEIVTLGANRLLLFYHLLEINSFNKETLDIFVNDIIVNWN